LCVFRHGLCLAVTVRHNRKSMCLKTPKLSVMAEIFSPF
jgi:hypothetical protein